jgi:hypothetical protein
MKKIIFFFLFFNLILVQNTFAKEEKTIFGFSLEFPSSKYVLLKEQNEATIKEFLRQNGYKDYKRIIPGNKPQDLTTSDALQFLYKEQQDETGKKDSELIIYMGGVVEKNSTFEFIKIAFVNELINFNELRDRKSLNNVCKEMTQERQILQYCEFENLKIKKKEFEIIKAKWNVTNSHSKKFERTTYFVSLTNGVIFYHVYCDMSCKKIEEDFPSIISSIK